jgi:hypothetical protein
MCAAGNQFAKEFTMFRLIAIAVVVFGSAMAETVVPKGATEVEPGVHRHTDTSGKTYIYRKTPFGIVKSLEPASTPESSKTEASKTSSAPATPTPFGPVKTDTAAKNQVKVVDRGDTLEFERPSPFGSYKWKKKKNDLTATEQEAWSQTRQESTTGTKE